MKRSLALVLCGVVLAGCSGGGSTPVPSGRELTVPELKLRVLSAAAERGVAPCGPPVVMTPQAEAIRRRLQAIHSANPELYRALLQQLAGPEDPMSRLALFRLNSLLVGMSEIRLQHASGGYRFDVAGARGEVQGTVSASGQVSVEQESTTPHPCPICLARGTGIATPFGPVAVQDLRRGMTVWSVDRRGRRLAASVLRTTRRRAWGTLLELTLVGGRTVVVSPEHPTLTGRPVGTLRLGDRLGDLRIVSVRSVAYRGFTYDLLPAGPTGAYLANGVLLGSTLSR